MSWKMCLNFTINWLNKFIQNLVLFTDAYSEPIQTSKMEILVKIKSGHQPLATFGKNSISNDWLEPESLQIHRIFVNFECEDKSLI